MILRATTGGVLKGYRKDLMSSFLRLNSNRDTVLTQRNFNTYAEDPAAAAQCYQLRRSYQRVDSQITISDSTTRKFQAAYSAVESVVNMVDNEIEGSAWAAALRGANDPTASGRTALGTELVQLADSIVQSMNGKYGDAFIFSGADGHTLPFSWSDPDPATGNKTLYYRGVAVDTAIPDAPPDVTTDADGNPVENPTGFYTLTTPQPSVDTSGAITNSPLANAADNTATFVVNDSDALMQAVKDAGVAADADITVNYDATAGEFQLMADGEVISKASFALPMNTSSDIAFNDDNGNALATFSLTYGGNADIVDGDFAAPLDTGVKYDAGTTISKDEYEAMQTAYETATVDLAKLDYMSAESRYVDIGIGLEEENSKLIEASAFNVALQGVNFLGYGVDENGDPNNIVSIINRLGNLLSNCKEESGEWASDADREEFQRLALKFDNMAAELKKNHVELTTKADFLKNNHKQLEDTAYTLNEQILGIEQVDLADAITSFSWAQYSYNAALKMGNSILSESLMDYLN